MENTVIKDVEKHGEDTRELLRRIIKFKYKNYRATPEEHQNMTIDERNDLFDIMKKLIDDPNITLTSKLVLLKQLCECTREFQDYDRNTKIN